MSDKITQEEFETRSRNVHGDRYDYSHDIYKGMNIKYDILCPTHGIFSMKPAQHIHQGQRCKGCYLQETIDRNKLKYSEKCEVIHSGKYKIADWGENFKNQREKVECDCSSHGRYKSTIHLLLNSTYGGCPKCKSLEEAEVFIKKAKILHKDRYIYKKEDYVCSRTPMNIYCTVHKKFFKQRPSAHLQGQGCPDCGTQSQKKIKTLSQEDYISRCKDVYGDSLCFNDTVYKGMHSTVKYGCHYHGVMHTTANNLLNGQGCPECNKENRQRINQQKFIDTMSESEKYKHFDFSKSVYINNITKIEVLCKDHNEIFYTTPNKLKDDTRTVGCKTCNSIATNRWTIQSLKKIPNIDKEVGHFYIGKVSGIKGYKIGITKNLETRFSVYQRDLEDDNLMFNYIDSISTTYLKACVIEVILKKYYKSSHIKHTYCFGGKSEIYNPDNIKPIYDIISGRFDYELDYISELCTHNNDKLILNFVDKLHEIYK